MPPKSKKDGPQKNSDNEMEDRLTRIAIVSADRCRPKKCRQECKKACPVVKVGTCAVAPWPAALYKAIGASSP